RRIQNIATAEVIDFPEVVDRTVHYYDTVVSAASAMGVEILRCPNEGPVEPVKPNWDDD
ncbi:MAG: hypothetical protein JWL85_313, partial [Candidatus Saccharibacteria bacterium]|nr:hypothetical protein [Candidatus Saccharibacteria bacterium]